MIVLVDYENTHQSGMDGYWYLNAGDTMILYYSDAKSAIPKGCVSSLKEAGVTVKLVKLQAKRDNALDMYIAASTGMYADKYDKICIVSKDKGYQAVRDFWNMVRGTEILLGETIEACMLHSADNKDARIQMVKDRHQRVNLVDEFRHMDMKHILTADAAIPEEDETAEADVESEELQENGADKPKRRRGRRGGRGRKRGRETAEVALEISEADEAGELANEQLSAEAEQYAGEQTADEQVIVEDKPCDGEVQAEIYTDDSANREAQQTGDDAGVKAAVSAEEQPVKAKKTAKRGRKSAAKTGKAKTEADAAQTEETISSAEQSEKAESAEKSAEAAETSPADGAEQAVVPEVPEKTAAPEQTTKKAAAKPKRTRKSAAKKAETAEAGAAEEKQPQTDAAQAPEGAAADEVKPKKRGRKKKTESAAELPQAQED